MYTLDPHRTKKYSLSKQENSRNCPGLQYSSLKTRKGKRYHFIDENDNNNPSTVDRTNAKCRRFKHQGQVRYKRSTVDKSKAKLSSQHGRNTLGNNRMGLDVSRVECYRNEPRFNFVFLRQEYEKRKELGPRLLDVETLPFQRPAGNQRRNNWGSQNEDIENWNDPESYTYAQDSSSNLMCLEDDRLEKEATKNYWKHKHDLKNEGKSKRLLEDENDSLEDYPCRNNSRCIDDDEEETFKSQQKEHCYEEEVSRRYKKYEENLARLQKIEDEIKEIEKDSISTRLLYVTPDIDANTNYKEKCRKDRKQTSHSIKEELISKEYHGKKMSNSRQYSQIGNGVDDSENYKLIHQTNEKKNSRLMSTADQTSMDTHNEPIFNKKDTKEKSNTLETDRAFHSWPEQFRNLQEKIKSTLNGGTQITNSYRQPPQTVLRNTIKSIADNLVYSFKTMSNLIPEVRVVPECASNNCIRDNTTEGASVCLAPYPCRSPCRCNLRSCANSTRRSYSAYVPCRCNTDASYYRQATKSAHTKPSQNNTYIFVCEPTCLPKVLDVLDQKMDDNSIIQMEIDDGKKKLGIEVDNRKPDCDGSEKQFTYENRMLNYERFRKPEINARTQKSLTKILKAPSNNDSKHKTPKLMSSLKNTTRGTPASHTNYYNPVTTNTFKTKYYNPALTEASANIKSSNPAISEASHTKYYNPVVSKASNTKNYNSALSKTKYYNPALTEASANIKNSNPAISEASQTKYYNPVVAKASNTKNWNSALFKTKFYNPALTEASANIKNSNPAISEASHTKYYNPVVAKASNTKNYNSALSKTKYYNPALTEASNTKHDHPVVDKKTANIKNSNPAISEASHTKYYNPILAKASNTKNYNSRPYRTKHDIADSTAKQLNRYTYLDKSKHPVSEYDHGLDQRTQMNDFNTQNTKTWSINVDVSKVLQEERKKQSRKKSARGEEEDYKLQVILPPCEPTTWDRHQQDKVASRVTDKRKVTKRVPDLRKVNQKKPSASKTSNKPRKTANLAHPRQKNPKKHRLGNKYDESSPKKPRVAEQSKEKCLDFSVGLFTVPSQDWEVFLTK